MDESEQLTYITQDYKNIQFIKNPSEQVQLQSVVKIWMVHLLY